MKKVLVLLIVIFAAETGILFSFAARNTDNAQDALAVNETVQLVQKNWADIENYTDTTSLDYVILDNGGSVVYRTKNGLSESINAAVINRDTILDIQCGGDVVGKIIINNDPMTVQTDKNNTLAALVVLMICQCAVCVGYFIYLNRRIVKPFSGLKHFARRVAEGNLDIPLEMDKGNIFGAFTESFDIMRSELKKARIAEAKANASKKELVAKLSHDIRTPIASIKAVSELGMAMTADKKMRENYAQIIIKTDQINTLVGNLFSSALEELQQLTVSPANMASMELQSMLESADYLHRAEIPDIPERIIYADKLRLQQVFDNIFANSYKYANTKVKVKIYAGDDFLAVEIEDLGGGVPSEELPKLKEKFTRGKNSEGIDGAGLGLYISDCFMKEMKGELKTENGNDGLKITVYIPLSGII